MARRYIAGAGQLLLALIGAGLVIAWFVSVMSRVYQQVEGDSPSSSAAWLGEAGAVAFIASWLWSLVTSLSLLREARAEEGKGEKR